MQYYILKKQKMFGKVEYETEMKARRGYENLADAIEKKIALETLNEHDGVEYIIVNDGTPIERLEEKLEEKKVDQVNI
jgi:hypothetical protein